MPAQKLIAAEMQRVAMDKVPYLPVGAARSSTALKQELRERVAGFPIF